MHMKKLLLAALAALGLTSNAALTENDWATKTLGIEPKAVKTEDISGRSLTW